MKEICLEIPLKFDLHIKIMAIYKRTKRTYKPTHIMHLAKSASQTKKKDQDGTTRIYCCGQIAYLPRSIE